MTEEPTPRLTVSGGGTVRLAIHAKPRAKKSQIVGCRGDALSVAIAAPPVDGAANAELERFLAAVFGVPRAQVSVVRGASGRTKLVDVEGMSVEAMRSVLDRALAPSTTA